MPAALPPKPTNQNAEPVGTSREADAGERAWEEDGFNPIPHPDVDFIAEGTTTYRVPHNGIRNTRESWVRVCNFVPRVVGEVSLVDDIDRRTQTNHALIVDVELESGITHHLEVRAQPDMSRAIVQAIPSAAARASVRRPREIASAAYALMRSDFASDVKYGQTGWVDGRFLRPGEPDVQLDRLSNAGGLDLMAIPSDVGRPAASRGARTLLSLTRAAPSNVTLPPLAAILAGPIFRRADHLGARPFMTSVVGPSGVGKTTLVSRIYSLHGEFWRAPQSMLLWQTTALTIEAYLHALRDLTVFIDNYRADDGTSSEVFRTTVLGLGDGGVKGRSVWNGDGGRVVPDRPPRSLVLATGEHGFEGDMAVNARLIEVAAERINIDALLRIPETELRDLPHLFALWVEWVGAVPAHMWLEAREQMAALRTQLVRASVGETRAAENIATLAATLALFNTFVTGAFPEMSESWSELVSQFFDDLDEFTNRQAMRILNDRLDALLLSTLARALRMNQVGLASVDDPRSLVGSKLVVGGFDDRNIYLMCDVITHWLSGELMIGRVRKRPIGRKELGAAITSRGGGDGVRTQKTFGEPRLRHGVWPIGRSGLGASWEGLLAQTR